MSITLQKTNDFVIAELMITPKRVIFLQKNFSSRLLESQSPVYGLKSHLDNGPLPVEEFAIVETCMAAIKLN